MPAAFQVPGVTGKGPVLKRDSRLKAGSLLMITPGSTFGFWASSMPANGTTVPNVAWEEAAAIVGGTESSLAVPITSTFVQGTGTGNDGFLQKTSKNGIHHIVSKVNAVDGHLYSTNLPAAISTYLNGTGKTHNTYLAASLRVTRAGAAGTSQYMVRIAQNSSVTRQGVIEGSAGTSTVAGGNSAPGVTSTAGAGTTTPGLVFADVAVNGTAATSLLPVLTIGGVLSATYHLKAPSWILYDVYLEDLDVSGRTYAQAHAECLAYHNAMFTTGGTYAGDTWNTPDTVVL